MGSAYYYFVASLPLISFDGKMPVTVEAFRQECQRLLSAGDYALIEMAWSAQTLALLPTGTSGNQVLDFWIRFEQAVRNELTWQRADRLNKDPLKYVRGPRVLEYSYAEEVQRLFKMDDLWEAERTLNKMKWRFLDDLSAGHYFDFEFLLIYSLKLQILQRLHEYGSPMGKNFLQELKTMPLPKNSLTQAAVKNSF